MSTEILYTAPALQGCQHHLIRDSKGVAHLCAVVPNGVPLVFWDSQWQLASPLIAEMIKKCEARK